jgi:hypothetical protein
MLLSDCLSIIHDAHLNVNLGSIKHSIIQSRVCNCIFLVMNHSSIQKNHPSHQKSDAYHQWTMHAQVTILRLRTGHNRLRHHMYHKFKIVEIDLCTCGTAPMTAKHLLQECPSYGNERTETWEQAVTFQDKL